MNRMWSLFSKSFSLKPYARQSALDTFPHKKSFNRVLSFFGSQEPFQYMGYHWVHLLRLATSLLCEDYEISYLDEPVG